MPVSFDLTSHLKRGIVTVLVEDDYKPTAITVYAFQ